MVNCDFCKTLELLREKENDARFREKYYARLYVETERDLNRNGKWTECGATTYRKSPLNYCPECGRNIEPN